MRGCTWEEHGGDNLWLLQRVDNAALEGLTDGRLQVAEQRHDEVGGGGGGRQEEEVSEGSGSSAEILSRKKKKTELGSYLIQERRSCQNSYMMKHDLSGRFWTETLRNK